MKSSSRPLQVFLCHASSDKPFVRTLYKRLSADGIDAWLDEEKLIPGQDWQLEIPKAVRAADIVMVCLSNKSLNKEGYVQKEIKYALDVADEKPEGIIYIIPVRIEDCPVPDRLKRWQWVNLFERTGYQRLLGTFRARIDALGLNITKTTTEPITETISETDNFLAWNAKELDGEITYHIELNNATLHFFQEEWNEFLELSIKIKNPAINTSNIRENKNIKNDSQTETVAETENFLAWKAEEPDGETTYHIELNNNTVHFFEEEWKEFLLLIRKLVK